MIETIAAWVASWDWKTLLIFLGPFAGVCLQQWWSRRTEADRRAADREDAAAKFAREEDARTQRERRDRVRNDRQETLRQTREYLELWCDARLLPPSSEGVRDIARRQNLLVKNNLAYLGDANAFREYMAMTESPQLAIPTRQSQLAIAGVRATLRLPLMRQEERILNDEDPVLVDASVLPELKSHLARLTAGTPEVGEPPSPH